LKAYSSHSQGEKMKRTHLIVAVLTTLVLLVSACSPQVAPATAPPPAADTAMPAEATAAIPNTGGNAANVMLGKDDKLGSFLVDDKGMTLYLYTKDTPNTSNCYDKCATAWPPLLTTGKPAAGDGVDASKFGTTTRKDGATQVTYNGWPLYYYAKDKKVGDITGQNVGSVWFVVSPAGDKVESSAAAAPTTAPATSSGPANVMVGKSDALGSFLVDDKGMTLYLFTKDSPNTSNCYDKCATSWPPLLTTGNPMAGDGADASKFGTTTRKDGTTQVTYAGWPLYYYAKDTKAGDTTGQGVGSVWYVISPAGEQITK
jgi:predicted lipoprotein with Yx(FWY)xxD motif